MMRDDCSDRSTRHSEDGENNRRHQDSVEDRDENRVGRAVTVGEGQTKQTPESKVGVAKEVPSSDIQMKLAKRGAKPPPSNAFAAAKTRPSDAASVGSTGSSSSSVSNRADDQVMRLSHMRRTNRQRRNTKSSEIEPTNDTTDNILSEKQSIASRSRQNRRKEVSTQHSTVEEEYDEENGEVVVTKPGAVRVRPSYLASSSTISIKEGVELERSDAHAPGRLNLAMLDQAKSVVKAFAVEEGDVEEPKVLATAEPFEEESKTPRRVLICIMIVIMIALAVSLSLTLTSKGQEELPPSAMPSMAPSMSPSHSSFGLLEMLKANSFDNGTALMQFGTPQYKAADWLITEHETGGASSINIEDSLGEGGRRLTEAASLLDKYSEGRILQRYAMATLYFSLGGDTWLESRNWLDSTVDECLWFMESETPCNKNREIVDLILRQNFLRGSIPAELALLSTAKIIDLSDNAIGSTIPTELGMLGERTESLILSSNNLEGTIPTELANLSGLRVLSLDNNNFRCPETPCIWGFDWVDCNSYNYIFPTEFGQLENLVVLSVASNPFAGEGKNGDDERRCIIPEEVGGLANSLQKLDLHDIGIWGFLPNSLGLLTNLVQLSLPKETQFWSPNVLDTLANLTELVVLSLSSHFGNFEDRPNFGRTIPSSIGNMSSLKVIRLDSPAFTGTIPTEIGLLADTLESLSFAESRITGDIPTELGRLTQLTKLQLQLTNLTSTIPTELGQLHKRLRHLDLHGEMRLSPLNSSIPFIHRTIPSELGALSRLVHLNLEDLMLTGALPTEVTTQLTRLEYLGLARTHVTGSIEDLVCDTEGEAKVPFASASIDLVNCSCCKEFCESYNHSYFNDIVYSCDERRVESDDDFVPPPLEIPEQWVEESPVEVAPFNDTNP